MDSCVDLHFVQNRLSCPMSKLLSISGEKSRDLFLALPYTFSAARDAKKAKKNGKKLEPYGYVGKKQKWKNNGPEIQTKNMILVTFS